ncbi:Regulatory protein LEU3 [Candida viswanathii]|uniref:Regulatory protein LEU3 n=1 Tax=Candida viswanathii TaxID=5486 RepID=A0A367YC19_9ASCO|nr:Regulatory protein LEU3 [Candida viswanathii]
MNNNSSHINHNHPINRGKSPLDNLVHIASNMSHDFNQSILLQQQSPSPVPLNQRQFSNSNSPTTPVSLSGTSTAALRSAKVKRMACMECRQQKSRCDAHEREPHPCSRCAKKGLECRVDKSYKRTYKRARIAQMEKEFQELTRTLSTNQVAELASKYPSLTSGASQPAIQSSNTQLKIEPGTDSTGNGAPLRPHSQPPSGAAMLQNSTGDHDLQPKQQRYHSTSTTLPSPYQAFSYNSSETNPSMPNTPSIARPVHSNSNIPDQSVHSTQVSLPEELLICEEKSVGTVTLSSETIRSLYLEYVERYHPILPVVDIAKGPERIFRLCPPLFWVIMFVSLRRFEDDSSKPLLLELSPIVKGVLAEIMISPITRYNPTEEDEPILNVSSVYSAQAFLLYSYWPPITSSLSADSSYNTVATAFFQAIRIGLHSPTTITTTTTTTAGASNDGSAGQKTPQQLAMIQEQIKTWIVCNIASQTIATAFGFPACTQFDSSIQFYSQTKSNISIPQNLLLMMEIAHFEDQMSRSLNSNPSDPCGLIDASERLPLLKLLGKRLDSLEMRLKNEMLLNNDKDFRIFEIRSARVHLLSYYFMDSSRIAKFELQRGLIKLYNAAISLVDHTSECQAKDKKFIKYLPGVYLLNLWQAGCIIGKLVHSSLKKYIDVGSGKQSYESVIHLTFKASILKHDMAYRSSGITRNMWQLFRTLDAKNENHLSIEIRNRMSASVFFDCLNLLRDQVGITKLSMKTDQSITAEAGQEEDEEEEEEEEEIGEGYGEQAIDDGDENEKTNGAVKYDVEKDVPSSSISLKTTPGSTYSSKARKARSLSNNADAESKARRIIRTIPLDPEPIAIGGTKRSSIFKVVNSSADSSPREATGSSVGSIQTKPPAEKPSLPTKYPMHAPTTSQSPEQQRLAHDQAVPQGAVYPVGQQSASDTQVQQHSGVMFNDSPIQVGLENLDMENFDSDVIWKDVGDLMNDFGFHAF